MDTDAADAPIDNAEVLVFIHFGPCTKTDFYLDNRGKDVKTPYQSFYRRRTTP
jgi:hypothetical protein